MPLFPLRIPDHPDWRRERAYSPIVARALIRAYTYLGVSSGLGGARRARDGQDYLRACACIEPVLSAPMSVRQRIHLCYVKGILHAAFGDYGRALVELDEALALAAGLPDSGLLVDLLYLAAAIQQARLDLAAAAADRHLCLDFLHDLRVSQPSETPSIPPFTAPPIGDEALVLGLELDVLTQLAGVELYLGHYEAAERQLDEAERLTPCVPACRLEEATIAWVRAQLARWRRQPECALRPAVEAAAVFTEAGPPPPPPASRR